MATPNESTIYKPFFMIYVEGGHSPVVQHLEIKTAIEEASRLTLKTGRPTHILQSISFAAPAGVEWNFADNVQVDCDECAAKQSDWSEEPEEDDVTRVLRGLVNRLRAARTHPN